MFLSLERAGSAAGVDFVRSQSAASYEATLAAPVVTASGATMVRAAMQPPWEMRLRTTTTTTVVVMVVMSRVLCLGDRLELLATQLSCDSTYEAFLSIYGA